MIRERASSVVEAAKEIPEAAEKVAAEAAKPKQTAFGTGAAQTAKPNVTGLAVVGAAAVAVVVIGLQQQQGVQEGPGAATPPVKTLDPSAGNGAANAREWIEEWRSDGSGGHLLMALWGTTCIVVLRSQIQSLPPSDRSLLAVT